MRKSRDARPGDRLVRLTRRPATQTDAFLPTDVALDWIGGRPAERSDNKTTWSHRPGVRMGPPKAGTTIGARNIRELRWLDWPVRVARWFVGGQASVSQAEGRGAPIARFRNIAISREAGAGGGTIARLVGTRLGWKVY